MSDRRNITTWCLFCLVLAATVLPSIYAAQEKEAMTVEEFVKARMEGRGGAGAARENFGPLLKADPNRAFEALMQYRNHPKHQVRSEMLRYVMIMRARHRSAELDRKIVRLLLELFVAKYDERGLMRADVKRYAPRFSSDVYDDDAKDLIRKAFREKRLSKDTLRLYSIANMKEDLPELRKAFEAKEWPPDDPKDETWYEDMKWAFRKVMAQFGDEESITYCVSRVDQEDRPRVKVGALTDLKRIRHPDVVRLLDKCLKSAEMVKGLHDSYPLSGHAVHALTQLLDGFPVGKKRGPIWYSKTDIAKCREWMNEQTEWKFKGL